MFKLIDLPYAPDALEPVISARTLEFHHGKHLQGYVDNLNKLIAGSEWEQFCQPESPSCNDELSCCNSERSEESALIEIVRAVSLPAPTGNPAIFNNAGQILNHNLYFTQFRPFVADAPQVGKGSDSESKALDYERVSCHSERSEESPLLAQIRKQWGSMDAFQAEFEQKGVSLFGSGWVWLAATPDGTLEILQCPGADNPAAHVMPGPATPMAPVMPGQTGHLRPLLTFDVWEHAYYLDYQNRRAAHLHALWQIVDWKVIEQRYCK